MRHQIFVNSHELKNQTCPKDSLTLEAMKFAPGLPRVFIPVSVNPIVTQWSHNLLRVDSGTTDILSRLRILLSGLKWKTFFALDATRKPQLDFRLNPVWYREAACSQ